MNSKHTSDQFYLGEQTQGYMLLEFELRDILRTAIVIARERPDLTLPEITTRVLNTVKENLSE